MAKQSGIGANIYVAGYDLSGDVSVINTIRDAQALLDVTGVDKSAHERIPGLADGEIGFTSFFNKAVLQEHAALKNAGAGDRIITVAQGTALGSAGWGLVGKQPDYSGARGADGSLALTSSVMSSNGDGMRAGQLLTAGKRTDTGATNGASVNEGGATAFGAVFFLQVFAFSGTDVTIKIQDSANDSAWSDVSGGGFTATPTAPTAERIALATNATVRQYLRVITTTSGRVHVAHVRGAGLSAIRGVLGNPHI